MRIVETSPSLNSNLSLRLCFQIHNKPNLKEEHFKKFIFYIKTCSTKFLLNLYPFAPHFRLRSQEIFKKEV